jgi:hypothetical protein
MTSGNQGCARSSGDLNLVATMMSLGIPLDPLQPVSLVETDHAIYSSYWVGEYSDDGAECASTISEYWSGESTPPPGHGYRYISEFIRARPKGIQKTDDLLGFAVDYLIGKGHALPGFKSIKDVPGFVNALPNHESSYILAYVYNRDVCYQLHRLAARKVFYENGNGDDARRAIIDTRLPRWKAKELLSRLEG